VKTDIPSLHFKNFTLHRTIFQPVLQFHQYHHGQPNQQQKSVQERLQNLQAEDLQTKIINFAKHSNPQ
jgi:hypothetical protein